MSKENSNVSEKYFNIKNMVLRNRDLGIEEQMRRIKQICDEEIGSESFLLIQIAKAPSGRQSKKFNLFDIEIGNIVGRTGVSNISRAEVMNEIKYAMDEL